MTAKGITKISVQGFKSLYDETSIEIRPLTLLAGVNSSGKSSIMQPLLLMKQTLEAQYEPRVFALSGANVRFDRYDEFLSKQDAIGDFKVTIEVENSHQLEVSYGLDEKHQLQIESTKYSNLLEQKELFLKPAMPSNDIAKQLSPELDKLRITLQDITVGGEIVWSAIPYRCFLNLGMKFLNGEPAMQSDFLPLKDFPLDVFSYEIQKIIHLAGFRGMPARAYPLTAVKPPFFQGTFENYTASVLQQKFTDIHQQLSDYMYQLGISKTLGFSLLNDAQLSILIGRVKESALDTENPDLVNIADVGFGVSQVLPILVALLVAQEGQLVYIEQPELHLHPRAQVKLAEILADAAKRGVRVVIETHSALLLLAVQTLIAEGKLAPETTILHWFTRDENGKSRVDSQVPDANGAYGDWAEDFGDVELDIHGRYLDAVTHRQVSQVHER